MSSLVAGKKRAREQFENLWNHPEFSKVKERADLADLIPGDLRKILAFPFICFQLHIKSNLAFPIAGSQQNFSSKTQTFSSEKHQLFWRQALLDFRKNGNFDPEINFSLTTTDV